MHSNQWRILALGLIIFSCEKPLEDLEPGDLNGPQSPVESSFDTPYELPVLFGDFTEEELREIITQELDSIKNSSDPSGKRGKPMVVGKDNPMSVYVHYMPWFQSLDYDGYWGQHWTMTNRNPDVWKDAHRRDIASYYYPLIGPYSSKDEYLQEYHFLLMKLAGIDGVIFDWYGGRNVWDYSLIREATESFMGRIEDIGLKYAIMYEDRVAADSFNPGSNESEAERLQADIALLANRYFVDEHYLKIQNENTLMVFGPHHITSQTLWKNALQSIASTQPVKLLGLWGTSDLLGEISGGEFLWISEDNLASHRYYYEHVSSDGVIVGSAYAGFHDFYNDGGWYSGASNFIIEPSPRLFHQSLQFTHHAQADFVQLITWNDFGEGTMIEPTLEYGFEFLNALQRYTRVHSKTKDLELAAHLYRLRQEHRENPEVMALLDRSYHYFKRLNLSRVTGILMGVQRFY